MKNFRGITLIALIITIIILLILAGITINMLLGENGILRHAEIAKEKYENKVAEENYELSKSSNKIDEYVNGARLTPQTGISMDTSRKIAFLGDDNSWDTQSYTYTATEDCFVTGWIGTRSVSYVGIKINDAPVGLARSDGSEAVFQTYSYYLRKNDVIKLESSNSNTLKVLYVYGLK